MGAAGTTTSLELERGPSSPHQLPSPCTAAHLPQTLLEAALGPLVLPEDVPVGDVVVGVREADRALLLDDAGLAERQDICVAPAAGQVGAAAMDDALVVHSDVTP